MTEYDIKQLCKNIKKVKMMNAKQKSKYSVDDIASWLIGRSRMAQEFEDGEPLSLMKLLKLLYYAEGCSLAIDNGSLFSEPILAWEHGPVIRSIWEKYHDDPYNIPFTEDDEKAIDRISSEDRSILGGVFNTFAKYSAWGLREKTHNETPWKDTTEDGEIFNEEIDRDLIKQYFKENYV